MSKVHPKVHFHFQAIIHSGEYFVSPRIRTEDFSTLATFAASALARDGLWARLHGRAFAANPADPISVQSSPVQFELVSALFGTPLRIQLPTWTKKPKRPPQTYLRAEKRGAHRRDRERIFPMPSTSLWPFVAFWEPFSPPSSGMRCSTTFLPPPRSLL